MREHKSKYGPRASETTAWNRTSVKTVVQASARAVRPASLAASAMPEPLEAGAHSTFGTVLEAQDEQVQHFQGRSASWPSVALRSSARPITKGCGGSGFGLLAGVIAQRTMRAGSVPQSALPNPSIERTFFGKPENASHLKR